MGIQIVQSKKRFELKDTFRYNFDKNQLYEAYNFLNTIKECSNSPLIELKNMSNFLGLNKLFVKDENRRCILKSFKILGATYAISKYICEKLNLNIEKITFNDLKSKEIKKQLGDITFTTCSDGNHGRAVAWACNQLGYKSVIYLNKGTDLARADAIKDLGGKAIITALNYDDTVRYANKTAKENGWIIIQDTSWEGYKEIPIWIMRGYSKMAQECISVLESDNTLPTHIFVQAGVGAMAGGVTAFLSNYFNENNMPLITVIEPTNAACYFESCSANDGHIHKITGDLESIMAGLACGEPIKEGWEVLKNYASHFIKCDDEIAIQGMKILKIPLQGDESITSGESGAVSMGLIYNIMLNSEYKYIKELLNLDSKSNILIFSTEGDTAPLKYRKLIWEV
ncbi:diaminopropionate ammonia-lyase [Oceanirhabdus sp. W0125-5]|uniref:diaminopropionate ammonia-lyase n=1 Tax=Oceanirhabdus sp. W0125-5 TaxID=2999116 RepID=UPI0022F33D9A|nr:diaminopropionate ammonia-lyase [Oceanirhabdus sp. W0125-5]WBW95081.1 diaminopropionate ammonia-lyase [Oceanirhabdus sp. W0125-5]